jgi:hypothetical protein
MAEVKYFLATWLKCKHVLLVQRIRPLEQGCSFHYAHTALHNQASKCCDDLLTPTSCIDILSTSNALFLDTPSSHIGTPQIPAH